MQKLFNKHLFKFLAGFLLVLVASFLLIAGANTRRVSPGSQFANPPSVR